MQNNERFMYLLERKKLSQKEFAKRVTEAWKGVSGRTLSPQAVTQWMKGNTVPKLSPNEQQAVISILDCTSFEWANAFFLSETQKLVDRNNNSG
jgi:transcriptional regulator with XRE-family HTH domain